MTVGVFRYSFSNDVAVDEAEMTLQLAMFAAEGLFGTAQVRLDFGYHIDVDHRWILIDGSTEVGASVAHIFTGLLLREFGEDSFAVERVHSNQNQPEEVAA
jgi:hypothetical protein